MEARIPLMELLEGLDDPRRAQGRRHPLPALLGLAVVAMLAAMTSYNDPGSLRLRRWAESGKTKLGEPAFHRILGLGENQTRLGFDPQFSERSRRG